MKIVPPAIYEVTPDGVRRPNEARQRERYEAVSANMRERAVREWLSDPANATRLRESVAEQLRTERTITETAPAPATAPPEPDPTPADPSAVLVDACLGHLTGTRPARSPFWRGVDLNPPDAA